MTHVTFEKYQAAELPDYGGLLAEKIRTTTQDFSKLTNFEKFVLDNGYKEFQKEMSLPFLPEGGIMLKSGPRRGAGALYAKEAGF